MMDNKLKDKIKKDLLDQLKLKNKDISFNRNQVESYMQLVDVRETLKADIDKNGIRIESKSGNGFPITKPNEAVTQYYNCVKTMTTILKALDLEGEVLTEKNDLDDYM